MSPEHHGAGAEHRHGGEQRRPTRLRVATAVEGLRFVADTPIILAVISLDLFAVLFGGAVALIPAVATERLGVGDIAYGWLRAAGVGAALMAVVLALRPVQRRPVTRSGVRTNRTRSTTIAATVWSTPASAQACPGPRRP